MNVKLCYHIKWKENKEQASTEQSAEAFAIPERSDFMPRKPKRPCAYPGCPELSEQTYCEKHRKQARQQYDKYERAPDIKKKYGREWKRIRDKYVKTHPYCERCYAEGRMTAAEEVHHRLPISRGGTHATENLMSLCRSCHNKIHIEMGDRHP